MSVAPRAPREHRPEETSRSCTGGGAASLVDLEGGIHRPVDSKKWGKRPAMRTKAEIRLIATRRSEVHLDAILSVRDGDCLRSSKGRKAP